MLGKSLAAGVAVAATLALAPTGSASPADDQFVNEVQYYVQKCPTLNNKGACIKPEAIGSLISTANTACFFLNEGRNWSETMRLVAQGRNAAFVNDPIGFMMAATKAYCPQYAWRGPGV